MATAIELLREGRKDEIWKKYCGFLDLSLDDFMAIQERLLLEQINLLSQCGRGRELLGGKVLTSVEEFRASVPFTTYGDYQHYLVNKEEEGLPAKTHSWLHTSGRSGEYRFKWIPFTEAMIKRMGECGMSSVIMSSALKKGHFAWQEGDNMLFALAPVPYFSGAALKALVKEFPFRFLPPMEQAVNMDFQDRIKEGFRLALKEGLDASMDCRWCWPMDSAVARLPSRSAISWHARLSRCLLRGCAMGLWPALRTTI